LHRSFEHHQGSRVRKAFAERRHGVGIELEVRRPECGPTHEGGAAIARRAKRVCKRTGPRANAHQRPLVAALARPLLRPDPLVLARDFDALKPVLSHQGGGSLRARIRFGSSSARQKPATAIAPCHVERLELERRGGERASAGGKHDRIGRNPKCRRAGRRTGVQPHVDAHDRTQGSQGAGEQLGEVVTGDILYDLAAGPRDRPV
jgi:hypothetical protein